MILINLLKEVENTILKTQKNKEKNRENRNKLIGKFRKTEHFIYRQWDRKITDKVLLKVLKNIKTTNKNTMLIISRKLLNGIHKELFIKINNNILITCFYEEFQNYKTIKKQNYIIINKIKK